MDYQAARERFGGRLQAIRMERALTQEQLGEALQKSTEHISFMERGERSPSFEMLLSLAEILKTSVAELFAEQGTSVDTLVEVIPPTAPLPELPDRNPAAHEQRISDLDRYRSGIDV